MEINRKVLIILLCLVWCILSVHADDPSDVMIAVIPDSLTSDPDDIVQAGIILNSAPDGLSGYNITIQLTNPDIADIIAVDFPSWAQLPKNGTLPADSVWCSAVDLSGDSGTVDITLVNISVKAITAGDTNITVIATRVEDRIGGRYYPEIREATLHINAPQPPPVANFTAVPDEGQVPLSVQFTDISLNNPTSWSWEFGDGNTSTQQDPLHTYITPGTYTVNLTVANDYGWDTASKVNVITAEPPCPAPIADFTAVPDEGPVPLSVQFTDISLNNPTSWLWEFGDGATSTLQNPAYTYTVPGTYTVNLTVTNACGSDTISKINVITAAPPCPVPVANFTVFQDEGPVPLVVQFTDTSTNEPISWDWLFGDGSYTNERNPSHTYAATGTYNVTLTASNGCGSDSISKDVYVLDYSGPDVPSQGWKFRSDLSNSGVYDDGGVRPEGALLWSYSTSGWMRSSPAVANGVVYLGSLDWNICALDAESGTPIWNYLTSGSVQSSPAVVNGVVYVGSDDENIYALDAASGTPFWTYPTSGSVRSSPAVANGIVYVGSDDGNIYALDAASGTPIWTYPTGTGVRSSPAVVNGVVYVGSGYGNIYALDAASGTPIWTYPTGTGVSSSPAVVNGVVYVGSWNGNIYALDAENGALLWSYFTGSGVGSSPAVVNGVVYVGSGNGNSYALDAESGAPIWSYHTGGSDRSSPAVANGVVYVGSDDNNIYALDAASGTPFWTYPTSGSVRSSPAVVNGVVYVGSDDNNIYALGPNPDDPPGSITNPQNTTYQKNQITWTWTDPAPAYFSHIMVYLDGVFQQNVTKGVQEFTATGLNAGTSYTISTRTVGTTGLINETWVNHTASTSPPPPTLSYLDPTTVEEGSPAFTLNVYGVGFTENSQIFWNGVGQPTQYLQSTQLSIDVPTDQVAHQRMVNITVYDNSVGELSNSLYFVVTGQPPSTPGWKFRSDLNNSGVYDDGGVRPEGALLWSYPTGGGVYSSPAVVNGVVYVGSDGGNIYALDAASGTPIWSYYPTGPWVDSSPAVAYNIVYVGGYDGNIYALDAASGTLIWSYPTGGVVRSSPAVANGVVYIGSDGGNIYALDAASGTLIWSYPTGSWVGSSPAVAHGVVYVGSGDGNIYALDAASGTPIWTYQTGSWVQSSPAIANGVVYVGSGNGNIYALDAASGTPIWTYATGSSVHSSPAIVDGNVYVGSGNGNIYALDASSGTPIWTYATGYWVQSSPAVANGVVYVGSSNGNIYALDAASGTPIWTYATGLSVHSSPAIIDGIVYVGSWDGYVYALGPYPDIPPDSVTNIQAITTQQDQITWAWTDPTFPKFSHVMVYLDGAFQQNVTKGVQEFTAYSLTPFTSYTISTRTVSTSGLINETWVNQTSWTKPLPPIANFTSNATFGQAPLHIQFTDNSTGEAITSRLWTFGDGGTSHETNPIHIYATPGLFTVSLEVNNDGGSNISTRTNYIRVFDATPITDFIADPESGTVPLIVQFYDTTAGSPTSWQWNFGDGTTSTFQSPKHTYTTPGNYTVTLTSGSSGGTNTMVKAEYIRVDPPAPQVDFGAWPREGPAPLDVEFYANVPYSWYYDEFLWDFGDGTNGSGDWVSHTYTEPGLYPVNLTVTSVYGTNSTTKADFINVTAPMPPIPDFEGVPLAGNAPLNVVFTDTSTGVVTTRFWDFGDGTTAWSNATQSIAHTYPFPGTYTVSLTAGNDGGQVTATKSGYVLVNPSGVPPYAAFLMRPSSGVAPLTVSFTDRSRGTPSAWQWDFGDGNTSTEQNPVHTYANMGTFRVRLTAKNSGGSSTYGSFVWVRSPHFLFPPLTPSPTVTPTPVIPPQAGRPPISLFLTNASFGSAPMTVQFTDLSLYNPTSWEWEFGDGSTSMARNPVYTYTAPGTYIVVLSTANPQGESIMSRRILVR